jgi:hypothetical protein
MRVQGLANGSGAARFLGEKGCMDDPSAFKCSVMYGVRRRIGSWRDFLTSENKPKFGGPLADIPRLRNNGTTTTVSVHRHSARS